VSSLSLYLRNKDSAPDFQMCVSKEYNFLLPLKTVCKKVDISCKI
jgi:hypothetical protein